MYNSCSGDAMTIKPYHVLYALVLVGVIVSMDLLFFRDRVWERLLANIGIVLVFMAFYLKFLKTR